MSDETSGPDLSAQLQARNNNIDDLIVDFLVRHLVGMGRDPDVFLAQVLNRTKFPKRPTPDNKRALKALEWLIENRDNQLPQSFVEALAAEDIHHAFAGMKAPRELAWLIGLLVLFGGADVEIGPASLDVPGLVEISRDISSEDINTLRDLLSNNIPDDAPYISRSAIPVEGVSLDEAREIAREISARFKSGSIKLPSITSRTKSYDRTIKSWLPDEDSTDRYFLGAGVVYQSYKGGACLFSPSVTVFLPNPSTDAPDRILLNVKPLEEQLGYEGRVRVDAAGVVSALAGRARLDGPFDRLPVGCSIRHPSGITGSVTCFVKLPKSDKRWLVTSAHVATNFGTTGENTALKRPTSTDPNADIAMVESNKDPLSVIKAGQVVNNDMAIASLYEDIIEDGNHVFSKNSERIARIHEIDPESLRSQTAVVEKFGCGSRSSMGFISKIDQTAFFRSPDGSTIYEIEDQFEISTLPKAPAFAKSTDSGAAVALRENQRTLALVGQIVCGNRLGGKEGKAYATPVSQVFRSAGMKLIGA